MTYLRQIAVSLSLLNIDTVSVATLHHVESYARTGSAANIASSDCPMALQAFNAAGGFNLVEPGSNEEAEDTPTSETKAESEGAATSVGGMPSSQPASTI